MPVGNGGVIGPANIPTTTSAKGVWSLVEQMIAKSQGIWPSFVLTDPYFDYTTLLLPGNGTNGAQNNTFLDSSTNNFTITRNGNTTQGTFSPFSQTGWSGSFNTSTTYLTVTDTSNLRFGSSNFTIEAFVYRAASGATQTIASKGASTPTGWVFQISSADKLVFTDTSTSITGATSLAANTWYYVAVVRAGTGSNQTTLYVNAVSDATGTSATTFSQTDNMKIGADRSNTNFANGYISNLRLSNTNRTISSTPTSALAADSNTIFLGLYNNRFQYTDSTAAFTNMTVTGTPSVQAFSPFNPTSSWSATTNGGSGYFDGSGDYLQTPASFGAISAGQAFTIELWFYTSLSGSTATGLYRASSAVTGSLVLILNSGTVNAITYGGFAVANVIDVTNVWAPNQWNHLALSRNTSNRSRIWLNGVSVGSSTSDTYAYAATTYQIGAGTGVNAFPGYMSNFRLVIGTAVYDPTQTTITVPTAPLTAITNTSLLLNFTNAGIYDATSKNDLETVGNAQISTTQSKWGGSSMSFDGTGDWLLIPDQPIQRIGTGNFTVEGWVYRNSSGTYGLIGKGTGTTGWLVSLNSSNQVVFTYGSSTITSTGTVSATTWTHIAVVREGTSTNQTKIYINGTNDGTGTVSTDFNQTNSMYVGADRTGGSAANAYMQDVRVTNYARYTANFTAPTAAFPTL
jgi:hypothetical protein